MKEIDTVDDKYFNIENTASMMLESYISTLQFYGNTDRRITKKEIEVIYQIQENLKLDDDFEMKKAQGICIHNDRKTKNHSNKEIEVEKTHLNYYLKKNKLSYMQVNIIDSAEKFEKEYNAEVQKMQDKFSNKEYELKREFNRKYDNLLLLFYRFFDKIYL